MYSMLKLFGRKPITAIQIVGQRCSGTNYLQTLCEQNIQGIEQYQPLGWKHGPFRKIPKDTNHILFLVAFRNPYNWVRSLHQYPHHAHKSLHDIPFSEFIRSEWYCVWNQDGGVKPGDERFGEEMMVERNPETGERYRNVFDLRAHKNRFYTTLPKRAKHVYFTTLEELEADHKGVLRDIAQRFDLQLNESIENVQTYKGMKKKAFKKKRYEPISDEDLAFMNEHIDWELEKKIGFSPDDYAE